jgi:hypothetical protein
MTDSENKPTPGEALAAMLKGEKTQEDLQDAMQNWADSIEEECPGTKVTFSITKGEDEGADHES